MSRRVNKKNIKTDTIENSIVKQEITKKSIKTKKPIINNIKPVIENIPFTKLIKDDDEDDEVKDNEETKIDDELEEDETEDNVEEVSEVESEESVNDKDIEEEEEEEKEDKEDDDYIEEMTEDIIEKKMELSEKEECILDYDDMINIEDKKLIIVEKEEKITINKLTKYEYVRILGIRAKQIENGAKIMIKYEGNLTPVQIANLEIKEKRSPILIKRVLPSGKCEIWKLKELIIDI